MTGHVSSHEQQWPVPLTIAARVGHELFASGFLGTGRMQVRCFCSLACCAVYASGYDVHAYSHAAGMHHLAPLRFCAVHLALMIQVMES